MLKTNPGLKSRFSERVHFHDFDANATAELLLAELAKKKVPLSPPYDMNDICRLAQRLVDSDDFGNGRDVVTWADRIFKEVAKGKAKRQRSPSSSYKHLEDALTYMLRSREARPGGQRCSSLPASQQPGVACDENAAAPPPARMEQKTAIAIEEIEPEPDLAEADVDPTDANPFDAVDSHVLRTLQDVLDEQGLNSEEGSQQIARMDPTSAQFEALVDRLVHELRMTPESAREQLSAWQDAQMELEKQIQQQKHKTMGAKPIWRCGVCGRANKPYIACWVAPYIVGYESVEMN